MTQSIFSKTKNLCSVSSFVFSQLPGGVIKGYRYFPLNPMRDDRSPGSFVIDLRTGAWKDFATGDGGGDIISLYAYLHNRSQYEAAKELSKYGETYHKRRDCVNFLAKEVNSNRVDPKHIQKLWGQSKPTENTVVAKYLASRGIQ
jgi:hypothetical protein